MKMKVLSKAITAGAVSLLAVVPVAPSFGFAGPGGAGGSSFLFPTHFAPPPPAPVAAVPEASGATAPASRDFVVYFPTNVSSLSPEARDVVREAASTAQSGPMSYFIVTGHTDTVGAADYNQALSERRADSVRSELIADGVPASAIEAKGVGESDLAVPTPQGVNEPRNRRTVITASAPGS